MLQSLAVDSLFANDILHSELAVSGVVPKPKSKVAQNREVLGQEHHYGGVRAVRCDGATLFASP